MMNDLGKLLLRVVLAVLILLHGINKLTNGVDGIQGMVGEAGLPPALAYGAFLGEVLGPILLLVGWYARVGAGLIALNMLFAIGLAHSHEVLALNQNGAWAIELQGMYLFTAVALMLLGPGRYAVNNR
ncbi:GntR family transcriptional regulator [Thiohalorhabdus denitrificans]|uniref:Putative oxidoreductase n=1 Tax=Thiohalorhabdus denitrificans TaxID=381306 RepID=A0A0P9CQ94_9GAMM|nr:DoxX family protein [Thiohalorhabdus denitrificans]KPV41313.1 GntR family transcriptional regulator [Thiohalorhabdus denitrificans]SCY22728.1 putative oxidoreductase [Thiohalorhabdus denitrificans]